MPINGSGITSARIFAVVDVYDALTSDRPYRKTWTREKTLDYVREQAEKHFDPQVVNIFNPGCHHAEKPQVLSH